ncbi:MAG: bifunctional heptose 7-phosphate kinase/heptose 1-phosphate adenyltransferase [Longimicrobiales bacterium]
MQRLTASRARGLLEGMRRVRALVVGDLMLDVYLRGAASRISPEAPVPVVRVTEAWRALGGAGNVASNVMALGGACEVVGLVGTDAEGAAVREELERQGVGGSGVVVSDERPTTLKTRIMARQQQVARYDREREEDVDPATAARVVAAIDRLGPACDVLVLEDYDKGVLVSAVIEAALDTGRRHGRPVVVDPKANHFFDYRGATLFKPNRGELSAALRAPVLADDAEWLERTRRHLDCSHLLVTLGEDGMALMTESGDYLRVPTVARSVYDVSGAGDTVTAVLALALGAGATPAEAAVLANHAAGIEVGKAGVATVTGGELLDAVSAARDT